MATHTMSLYMTLHYEIWYLVHQTVSQQEVHAVCAQDQEELPSTQAFHISRFVSAIFLQSYETKSEMKNLGFAATKESDSVLMETRL